MALDLTTFFLDTLMDTYEYMKIKYDMIPQHKGSIYIEIRRGMYGLKQACALAKLHLGNKLKYGYVKVDNTSGLWKYISQPITFTLYVDDSWS